MIAAGRLLCALLLCFVSASHAEEPVKKYYVWQEKNQFGTWNVLYSEGGWDSGGALANNGLQGLLRTLSGPAEVYVKEGTYKLETANDTFSLNKGVKLYGGCPGDAAGTDVSRDGTARTTLTRKVAGNAAIVTSKCSAASKATPEDTCIDGFTITGGNNNKEYGGGMYNENSSPLIENCTFEGNKAIDFGGGMYNTNSSPLIENCTFKDNTSAQSGGGIYNNKSSPVLINCALIGNSALNSSGGGMYNELRSEPTLIKCTLQGNTAGLDGGALYNRATSHPTLINCTLTGNEARNRGGGIYNDTSAATLVNCTLIDNTAVSGSGMYNTGTSAPVMVNSILWGAGAAAYSDSTSTSSLELQYCLIRSSDDISGTLNDPFPGSIVRVDPLSFQKIEDDILGVHQVSYEPENVSLSGTSTYAPDGVNLVPAEDQFGRAHDGGKASIGSGNSGQDNQDNENGSGEGDDNNNGNSNGGDAGQGSPPKGTGGANGNGTGSPSRNVEQEPALDPISPDVPVSEPELGDDVEDDGGDDERSGEPEQETEAGQEEDEEEEISDERGEVLDPAGGTCSAGTGTLGLGAVAALFLLGKGRARK